MTSEFSAEKDAIDPSLVGHVAAREFGSAKEVYRERLREWAVALHDLSDADFLGEAASAIHGSALVNSWRGNWEHEHFKASACHHESNRRKTVEHADDCEASTLYERAWNSTVRSQGHGHLAHDLRPCTCQPSRPGSSDGA